MTTLLSILLINQLVCGQALHPVTWGFSIEKTEGNALNFLAKANIGEGWNIYSLHVDPLGPMQTSVNFDEIKNLSREGGVLEKEMKPQAGIKFLPWT